MELVIVGHPFIEPGMYQRGQISLNNALCDVAVNHSSRWQFGDAGIERGVGVTRIEKLLHLVAPLVREKHQLEVAGVGRGARPINYKAVVESRKSQRTGLPRDFQAVA